MIIETLKENIFPVLIVNALVFSFATYYFLQLKKEEPIELGENVPEYISVDLSGAVEVPGIYELPENSRVADLLREAGGVNNDVSKKWLAKSLNVAEILSDEQKIYIPFEWELQDYEAKSLSFVKEPLFSDLASTVNVVKSAQNDSATEGSSVYPASKQEDSSLINVNTASFEALESLPRVGKVTAEKIMNNRPYSDLQDLKDKASLFDSVIDQIGSLVEF